MDNNEMKSCHAFKSLDRSLAREYRTMHTYDCKDCVYCNDHTCSMESSSYKEPDMAFFM
ncbi:MAG: hypothetical protein LBL96_02430 [Clostridiales bacterium]|jgi:hypothetical protein|nr:hypothetical protein [Clostridiales bacterium]